MSNKDLKSLFQKLFHQFKKLLEKKKNEAERNDYFGEQFGK